MGDSINLVSLVICVPPLVESNHLSGGWRKFVSSLLSLLLVFGANAFGQETMTPARFREIVALPGDAVPLVPPLVRVPFWTNSTVNVELKYATGKVFQEEVAVKARTVSGKYVVFDGYSQFYHQPMSSLLTYDEKSSDLKLYGLYADSQGNPLVTVGVGKYDATHKTYTVTSAYGEGFKETTQGVYTDTEDTAKTVVLKNGVLFMTRVVKTHPLVAK